VTGRDWPALAVVVLLTVTATGVGGASAATPSATETTSGAGTTGDAFTVADGEAFVVDLREDGSARVTVSVTFDLTTDAEREAFERLRDNETVRTRTRDRFAERMNSTAEATADSTGREMNVTDPSIAFESADGGQTGVVALSVTWHDLAATTGDDLVVTAPFANEFDSDRALVVRAPDGYRLDSVSPSPAAASESFARWSPNQSLDGFRAVAAPTAESSEESTGGDDSDGGSDADATSALKPPAMAAAAVLALTLALAVAVRLRN
jgi:hypothetical protein